MLYQEMNEYDMQKQLADCDRDNFSVEALRAYVDFCEELEENVEFDPVGFDCSFIEFDLSQPEERAAFINDYGYLIEGDTFDDEDDTIEAIKGEIESNTLVICADSDCFVFEYNF